MNRTSKPPAAGVTLRFDGRLSDLDRRERDALLQRAAGEDARVSAAAAAIVERVRTEGDDALRALATEFDGVTLASIEVPRARAAAALAALEPGLRAALERAAANLRLAHEAQRASDNVCETEPGVRIGRRAEPFERVGVYAPGGRARYPSSVLMGAIPARVAGVREIVLCTPPGPGGEPDALLLAAAELAGVDRIFALGGAGAIAALAYGTASVPRVRKIVGPGNAYVSAAKQLVSARGVVAIDSPAGPSELVVIADDSASPERVALELVAQAEHDPDAIALALVVGQEAARRVRAALLAAAGAAERAAIVAASLAASGGVLECASLEEACAYATELAPEHLLLAVAGASGALALVRDAGTIFVGESSSVAFGDYLSGGNHVLPTAGHARLTPGLSTSDFVRWTTWQEISPAAATRLASDTARLALAEGLPGHAAAARSASTTAGPALDPPLALDDNTNHFGVPPVAGAALRDGSVIAARYPTPDGDVLGAALSAAYGLTADELVTGFGSDDVLEMAFRALGGPGRRVAWTTPTFTMIPAFVAHSGATAIERPAREDGSADLEALIAADADLVYVCSPNNPTGALTPDATLDALLERTRGIVLLDEAYAEFAAAGAAPAPRRHPRLVVARTFSKAWGLAGLRVGWASGDPAVMARVRALRAPFRMASHAERAAAHALSHDGGWVAARAAEAVAVRERVREALLERGLRVLPSRANFVLLPVRDARAAATALLERGVRVRPFAALPGIGDAVRMTIAPWPVMASVVEQVADALAGASS